MSTGRRVYSTEHGRTCPRCNRPLAGCRCAGPAPGASARGDGTVRVSRSTQGRKGKGVTVITGVPLDEEGLRALAKELKARCGAGGAVKAGAIEIQGEHRDLLVAELQARGWKVKRAGG